MRSVLVILSCAMILGSGCSEDQPRLAVHPDMQPAAPPEAANPASVNCLKAGGRLSIEKNPAGGEVGICLFEDNRQCEEWALLRGECPVGGRRITGYATRAGRWCAVSGGEYTDVTGSGASDERGNCILPGGKKCDAEAYWRGTCGR
jgi:putative hemolysin